jgi:hypothetical protein
MADRCRGDAPRGRSRPRPSEERLILEEEGRLLPDLREPHEPARAGLRPNGSVDGGPAEHFVFVEALCERGGRPREHLERDPLQDFLCNGARGRSAHRFPDSKSARVPIASLFAVRWLPSTREQIYTAHSRGAHPTKRAQEVP